MRLSIWTLGCSVGACTAAEGLSGDGDCAAAQEGVPIGTNTDAGLGFSPQDVTSSVAGTHLLAVDFAEGYHALGRAEEEWLLTLGIAASRTWMVERSEWDWSWTVGLEGGFYRLCVPVHLARADEPSISFVGVGVLEAQGVHPEDVFVQFHRAVPWTDTPDILQRELADLGGAVSPLEVDINMSLGRLARHPEHDPDRWQPGFGLLLWSGTDHHPATQGRWRGLGPSP